MGYIDLTGGMVGQLKGMAAASRLEHKIGLGFGGLLAGGERG